MQFNYNNKEVVNLINIKQYSTVIPWNSRKIYEYIEIAVFLISMLSNIILVALIKTKKNRSMKAYARVLIMNSCFDVANTFISFVTSVV